MKQAANVYLPPDPPAVLLKAFGPSGSRQKHPDAGTAIVQVADHSSMLSRHTRSCHQGDPVPGYAGNFGRLRIRRGLLHLHCHPDHALRQRFMPLWENRHKKRIARGRLVEHSLQATAHQLAQRVAATDVVDPGR